MRLADNTVVTTATIAKPDVTENAVAFTKSGDAPPTTTRSTPSVVVVQKAPEPLFNLKATTRYFLTKLHGELNLGEA